MKGTESAKNTLGYWRTFFSVCYNKHSYSRLLFRLSCCHGHQNLKRKIFFQMTFFLFFTYFQHWEFAYSSLSTLGVKRMNWNKNSGVTMDGFEYFGTEAHLTYCTNCCHKNYFVVKTIRIKVKSLNKKLRKNFTSI